VVGDYVDMEIPNLTGTFNVELMLDLKTATDTGWYTRFRIIVAGNPAANSTAVIGSYTGNIYASANYSVVTINGHHYLRCALGGVSSPITTKVVRWRYRTL
jgi:hypothetical protein